MQRYLFISPMHTKILKFSFLFLCYGMLIDVPSLVVASRSIGLHDERLRPPPAAAGIMQQTDTNFNLSSGTISQTGTAVLLPSDTVAAPLAHHQR